MSEIKMLFGSIDDTSKFTRLSKYYLRQGIREGWIPHIKCGRKNMINITKLLQILDSKSESVNSNC